MSKLTDLELRSIYSKAFSEKSSEGIVTAGVAALRAIESAATEPLLQRMAELERQLEEARAQIGQGVPDGWQLVRKDTLKLAIGFAIHAMRRDRNSPSNSAWMVEAADRNIAAVRSMLASAPPAPQANKTHVLVPLRMTRAMQDVVSEEDWSWAELLAAAEAVTEEEFTAAEQAEPIMPKAAVVQQKPLTDERAESSVDYWQQRGYLGNSDEWREACRLFRVRCSTEDIERMAKLRAYIEDGLLMVLTPPAPQQIWQGEHVTDGSKCWCDPELDYKDPDTGVEVWVHRSKQ